MDGASKKHHGRSQTARQLAPGLLPPTNPLPAGSRSNRASKSELDQRVMYTTKMLLDGRRKHEIKRFFRQQYGVKSRQVERYLQFARERIAEHGKVDVDRMKAEFYARYMQIYRDAENDSTKINALKAAGAIYGVDAPRKVADTTVRGEDVDHRHVALEGLSVEQLRVLQQVRTRLRQLGEKSR